MGNISELQPRGVWEQFEAITQVPRPSKKEEQIIEFLIAFAKQHSLEWQRDDIGNVVIRKGATKGYEERETVILQSHMDMVCEKNSDVAFDFDTQPIKAYVEDGWVRAEGTTLGADCGIGMAAAMARWRCSLPLTRRLALQVHSNLARVCSQESILSILIRRMKARFLSAVLAA